MKFSFGRILLLLAAVVSFNLGYSAIPQASGISFYAPAINEDGQGSLVGFEMRMAQGNGRTLVNVQNAFFNSEVEDALRKARLKSDEFLGASSSYLDIYLEVKGQGKDVSGESAGGMFAVALVALRTGRHLREDAAISAMIDEQGELAEVGGIEEKIIAAREMDRKYFLVAKGQKIKDEGEIASGIGIIRVRTFGDAVSHLLE